MTLYTLSTRFARFENDGEYKEYPAGVKVDLSPEEVRIFAPGVATMSSGSSEVKAEVKEDNSGDSSDSRAVFRTTLAQPKKRKGKLASSDAPKESNQE